MKESERQSRLFLSLTILIAWIVLFWNSFSKIDINTKGTTADGIIFTLLVLSLPFVIFFVSKSLVSKTDKNTKNKPKKFEINNVLSLLILIILTPLIFGIVFVISQFF